MLDAHQADLLLQDRCEKEGGQGGAWPGRERMEVKKEVKRARGPGSQARSLGGLEDGGAWASCTSLVLVWLEAVDGSSTSSWEAGTLDLLCSGRGTLFREAFFYYLKLY